MKDKYMAIIENTNTVPYLNGTTYWEQIRTAIFRSSGEWYFALIFAHMLGVAEGKRLERERRRKKQDT